MMKRMAFAASALIASALFASSASAQVAPGTYNLRTTGSQFLRVRQSVSLDCQASLNLIMDTGNAGRITAGSLSPGVPRCSNVALGGFDWTVSVGTFSGGVAPITVSGVNATTILGSCNGGVLSGTITSAGVVSITSSSGWSSSPPIFVCSVLGQLTL